MSKLSKSISLNKKSKGTVLILLICAALILIAIIAIFYAAAVVGDRSGSMSGSGVITERGTADGEGPTETTPGSGACTWSLIRRDPPDVRTYVAQPSTVPIWVGTTNKQASTKTLYVHRNCVETIKTIFTEAYNDPSKPPVDPDYFGCYSHRAPLRNGRLSRHNYGAACDVSFLENFCGPNCYNVSGQKIPSNGWWKPGNKSPDNTYAGWSDGFDPRSIPLDGVIARAFKNQGWGRGMYRGGFNDYMHFSVDGH